MFINLWKKLVFFKKPAPEIYFALNKVQRLAKEEEKANSSFIIANKQMNKHLHFKYSI